VSIAIWADELSLSPVMGALRERYGPMKLRERFAVSRQCDADMSYLEITSATSLAWPPLPSAEDTIACLRARLSLVFGIGPVTEQAMRSRETPVIDLADFAGHERYGRPAEEILSDLDNRRLDALLELVRTRMPGRGQLLATRLAALADPSRVAVLDFETLGIFGNVIFLAGLARFESGRLVVRQFLADGYDDEPAMLRRVVDELAGVELLLTYNGRTADVPWLTARAVYHRLGRVRIPPHLDLLHASRQRYVRELAVVPDARLPTIQRHVLGMRRPDPDVPGILIPLLYKEYRSLPTQLEGLLIPVLEHNRSDVEAVAALLGRLASEPLGTLEGPDVPEEPHAPRRLFGLGAAASPGS
jgi:uncharacterized protein YprB with RNaseH-like and TPR domain